MATSVGDGSSSGAAAAVMDKSFEEILADVAMTWVPSPLPPLFDFDVGGLDKDDVQFLDFVAGLPHTNCEQKSAEEFGTPYLPDSKSVAAVDNFWAKNERKKKYLSHLQGNVYMAQFIDNTIDAKTCVGMLRSVATEYGYRSIHNLATMAVETIKATEQSRHSLNNSVCVEAKHLLLGDERPSDMTPLAVEKPDSLHPVSTVKNSEIFRKVKNPTTKAVSLDWSEAAAKIDAASCRVVAALTNLICALVMPAYTLNEVVGLTGQVEQTVLRRAGAAAASADKKDALDEMCVLACLHSLVQYFSSSNHLFSAPLRLPPFDKHPVVNLRGSEFFFPGEKDNGSVLATMSVPSSSTLVLKHRRERRSRTLLCKAPGGITAHILSPDAERRPNKRRRKRNKRPPIDKRDPFIHVVGERERPLLMRNVLTLSGNYGWFGLTLGHTPSAPDIIFAKNKSERLFPIETINKIKNKTVGGTPSRNRNVDLRFHGLEIAETVGYTSCFRIRPASLCNSGPTVKGLKNPFVTQMGKPRWYDSRGLCEIFGQVDLKNHVAALDNTIHRFAGLVEGDLRWRANQQDKVAVLEKCISLLVRGAAAVDDDGGHAARSSLPSSRSKRLQMCNTTESAIIAAQRAEPTTTAEDAATAVSVCRMLTDECVNNPDRFFEGECRVAAHDFLKYLYRNSARRYTQSCLVRGLKMSTLWRRPYDQCADRAFAGVPRCRIPQLVAGLEEKELALPALQILATRDVNPRPMRHIVLSMVYGEALAKDISAANCLEWVDWCTKTAGKELMPLVKNTPGTEHLFQRSAPVYDIMFPDATTGRRKRKNSTEETLIWPPPPPKKRRRTTCCANTARKTGRLGHKEVFAVALSSLPHV